MPQRVALCLAGIVGGMGGKNGKGELINYVECARAWDEYFIQPYEADVYIHSWTVDRACGLCAAYLPKAAMFEPQIDFGQPGPRFCLRSQWYSRRECFKLIRGAYDYVVLSRFDLLLMQQLPLPMLENHLTLAHLGSKAEGDFSIKRRWLHDVFVAGSLTTIRKLICAQPDYWFMQSSNNPHKALSARVRRQIGEPRDIVDFWGWASSEWNLYRWKDR